MQNKRNRFGKSERIIKSTTRNENYGFQLGLTYEQIFYDTVKKANAQGLIAGQASSLYQLMK
jgi:hypothetical protein